MPLRQLVRAQWQEYFDRLSRALDSERVEIGVTGLGLGEQIETDWIRLTGISYDPEKNVLAVIAEGIDHLIRQPRRISIDHDAEWLYGIEATDADGHHHFIVFKAPLIVPAP